MKRIFRYAVSTALGTVAIMALSCRSCQEKTKECSCDAADTVRLVYADSVMAMKLVTENDTFINNLSRFDVLLRLGSPDFTKEDYKSMTAASLQSWTDNEKKRLDSIAGKLNTLIRNNGYRLPLPEGIILVKSDMSTEIGALGYTRNKWIALSGKLMEMDDNTIQTILAHEIFHVLTRNNLEFKKSMYGVTGFTVSDSELEFPEDIMDLKISNPDVDRFDSYITLTIDGKERKCAMLMCADTMAVPDDFNEIFKGRLVMLDENMECISRNGKTLTIDSESVPELTQKMGGNTGYTINPEENLADNFSYIMTDILDKNLNTPEITVNMKTLMKKGFCNGKKKS